ncbi:hypothetical protein [Sporolactobacillus terrae]|uniref:hypothetical protein n=1 Tax=Sporolactobacillus terrae TaxID=269673 RepID=UPI001CBC3043|nr:hypothetical protein [Sporolactobacillus terrae]UAK18102.1 hypothetical protein K7399_15960 [Sporolactobacillus terrae]
MTQRLDIRLDDVHAGLIDKMLDYLKKEGYTNVTKTDLVQKSLYYYAKHEIMPQHKIFRAIKDSGYKPKQWKKEKQ